MATSLITEEERGVYRGSPVHPHNGYWAGDFSSSPAPRSGRSCRPARLRAPVTPVVPKLSHPVADSVLPATRHRRTSGESLAPGA